MLSKYHLKLSFHPLSLHPSPYSLIHVLYIHVCTLNYKQTHTHSLTFYQLPFVIDKVVINWTWAKCTSMLEPSIKYTPPAGFVQTKQDDSQAAERGHILFPSNTCISLKSSDLDTNAPCISGTSWFVWTTSFMARQWLIIPAHSSKGRNLCSSLCVIIGLFLLHCI